MAAVRELIQNAMDANRMRAILDKQARVNHVGVDIYFEEEKKVRLFVQDQGVGMSEQEIVDNLLSFGTSGWMSDPSIGEYTNEMPIRETVSGQYGIGFFQYSC